MSPELLTLVGFLLPSLTWRVQLESGVCAPDSAWGICPSLGSGPTIQGRPAPFRLFGKVMLTQEYLTANLGASSPRAFSFWVQPWGPPLGCCQPDPLHPETAYLSFRQAGTVSRPMVLLGVHAKVLISVSF